MKKERFHSVEVIPQAPTSAPEFFEVHESELGEYVDVHQELSTFERNFRVAENSVVKFAEEVSKKNKTVKDLINTEILEQKRVLYSSVNHSRAYLRIWDELSEKGVSEEEIFSFFVDAAKTNSERIGFAINDNGKNFVMRAAASPRASVRNYEKEFIEKRFKKIPSWFEGNYDEWFNFVGTRSSFSILLNPERVSGRKNGTREFEYIRLQDSDYCSIDYLPAWFRKEGEIPSIEEVSKDLETDEVHLDELLSYEKSTIQNVIKLKELSLRKSDKMTNKYETWRSDLYERTKDDIRSLSLFLDVTRDMPIHTLISFEELIEIDAQSYRNKYVTSPEEFRNEALATYSEENSLTSMWIYLFLEKKASVSSQGEGKFREYLSDFIYDNEAEIQKLRNTDKRTFKAMNYEVAPLLSLLDEGKREELSAFLSEENRTNSQCLMILAEMISESLQNRQESDPQTKKLQSEFKRFTFNWVNQNWEWVKSRVKESIEKGKQSSEVIEEIDDEVIETEQLLEESQQGNLRGWNMYYVEKFDAQERNLVQIDGENLEEREQHLSEYLQKEDVDISIKHSSIIHALDWFVSVPEKTRSMWIRERINGVNFLKIKRGQARIFCNLNSESKELYFFLYQKKSQEYRFRN